MALLDELKQEADRIRREGGDTKSLEAKRKLFYEEHTKPALQHLYKYLSELKEQLHVIKPEVAASYEIQSIGTIATLAQNYAVQIDSANRPMQVGFLCTATATGIQRGIAPDERVAKEIRDIFNRMHHQFAEWPVRGFSGTMTGIRFEFTLNVPVSVQFTADLTNMTIHMVSSNLEGFRTLQHRIKPDKIDDAWLDRLGLYLLRRGPDPSVALLSEAQREQLRQRLRLTQEREGLID